MLGVGHRKRITLEDGVFDTVNTVFLIIVMLITVYPFINMLAISFNNALDTIRGGITIFPRAFTLDSYVRVFSNKHLFLAAFISLQRAVIGPLTSVAANVMVAYCISRREYVLKSFITKFFVITMYINGGLIPVYFLMRDMGLRNNFLVYILPWLMNGFYIMVLRSYINGISDSMVESARIDGASEYRVLFQIIIPLAKPALATITLWIAVAQWNSWYDNMLYCPEKQALSTLQYELQKILITSQPPPGDRIDFDSIRKSSTSSTSLRAAMTIIATLPILFSYPFLQRYFVKGLTLGGVKG